MADREKTLDEPVLLSELRSLPRRYLGPGGKLDAASVRLDLGLASDDALKDALLALYRLDAVVAHRVNGIFVRALLAKLVGKPVSLLEVPPWEESAWLVAEQRCAGCPGSEERPVFEGGPVLPLCQARERIERWEYCLKFRENLRAARDEGVDLHEESLALAKATGMAEAFEREVSAAAVQLEQPLDSAPKQS